MSEPETNPYDAPEYTEFVALMVPHCRCREGNRPCEGVLAGGLCDDVQDDLSTHSDDSYDES